MTILWRRSRPGRSAARPSVREVCLLGVKEPDSTTVWAPGDRLAWGGRAYRVEATRSPPVTDEEGTGTGLRYVYLTSSATAATRPVG